jgi:hypothetical protein
MQCTRTGHLTTLIQLHKVYSFEWPIDTEFEGGGRGTFTAITLELSLGAPQCWSGHNGGRKMHAEPNNPGAFAYSCLIISKTARLTEKTAFDITRV